MRLAIVGLGWWGKHIAKTLESSAKLSVALGVDVLAENRDAFTAQSGKPAVADLTDALKRPAIDAVVIATPHSLHEQQALQAIAAGKQVFCEKPLALTAASADRILAAAGKANITLGIGHERRYEAAMEKIGRSIATGDMGRILHLEANVSHDNFKRVAAGNWRLNAADAPAGAMTALGIHLTDLFQSFGGPIRTVRAYATTRVFTPPAQDVLNIQLEFASGASGTITCLSSTPFYARFNVFGEHGSMEARDTANVDAGDPTELVVIDHTGKRASERLPRTDTVRANFEAWADAVAGRGAYRFSRAEVRHNIAVLDAITRSAATGNVTLVE
jgi:predicted dehydrogenase